MRRFTRLFVVLALIFAAVGCEGQPTPTAIVPGQGAPFPPTWTPTSEPEATATATLVVVPTPTWDGTPPPPSEAYVPLISPSRLDRALESGEPIMVIDVRNRAAYNQVHIPDALHIPLEDLEDRVNEVDGNKTIVLYCTSPNRSMSLEAAMTLYRLGFSKIAVLEGGLQTWYSTGYPIEGEILTPTVVPGPPGTVTPLPTEPPVPTSTLRASLTPFVTRTPTLTATLTITPTSAKTD
ncbi:MAG: rhodanese-like domain-containing protein [Anaerolineae bacterium]|nr:rhodanese-like domain-containing protein [Anaerolineae bacterium]